MDFYLLFVYFNLLMNLALPSFICFLEFKFTQIYSYHNAAAERAPIHSKWSCSFLVKSVDGNSRSLDVWNWMMQSQRLERTRARRGDSNKLSVPTHGPSGLAVLRTRYGTYENTIKQLRLRNPFNSWDRPRMNLKPRDVAGRSRVRIYHAVEGRICDLGINLRSNWWELVVDKRRCRSDLF